MANKKILVISDTHGRVNPLLAVFKWAKERTPPHDTICCTAFLGDGLGDLQRAADHAGFFCDWKLVKGNNDYGYQIPESAVFDFCGSRFYLCHGHRHNLYSGYQSLVNAANANGANVVLFGHTHSPYQDAFNGVRLINPGSVGSPRSRLGATFAVIECKEDEPLKADFWEIDEKNKIKLVPKTANLRRRA